MRMMKLLIPMLLLVCLLAAGCSGLIARGPMAENIDVQAANAQANLPAATAGTIAPDVAMAAIENNAATFQAYRDAKTGNIFAYWFDPQKTILVNAAYSSLIDRTAALAAESQTRAATQPAWYRNRVLVGEYTAFIKVKDAKDGKAAKP